MDAYQEIFAIHPYYGFTLKPGLKNSPAVNWDMAIDRYGFRNGSLDFEELPDADIVIGFLGGSAAFAYGVSGNENSVPGRIEEFLNTGLPSPRFHVVNFGVMAWHYPQQLILASRVIEHLDAIIIYDGWN